MFQPEPGRLRETHAVVVWLGHPRLDARAEGCIEQRSIHDIDPGADRPPARAGSCTGWHRPQGRRARYGPRWFPSPMGHYGGEHRCPHGLDRRPTAGSRGRTPRAHRPHRSESMVRTSPAVCEASRPPGVTELIRLRSTTDRLDDGPELACLELHERRGTLEPTRSMQRPAWDCPNLSRVSCSSVETHDGRRHADPMARRTTSRPVR